MPKDPFLNVYHPMARPGNDFDVCHSANQSQPVPRVFHTHDFYEIYFLISGQPNIYIEEYEFSPQPGSVIIFPPGFMHRPALRPSNLTYERMYIHISRDCLNQMKTKDLAILPILEHCALYHRFLYLLDETLFAMCIETIKEVVLSTSLEPDPFDRQLNRLKIAMMLTCLCRFFQNKQGSEPEKPHHLLAQLISYINENLAEDLSLGHLSEHFFVSKHHMQRLFKERTQKTLHQYIVSKRIILAKNLLEDGHSPTETASLSGFKDYSGFYRVFKEETLLTPREYQASLKRQLPIK